MTDRTRDSDRETLTRELEALREQCRRLTDRVDDLETEVETLEQENDRLHAENDRLRDRVADLEADVDALEDRTERHDTDADSLRADLERVESKADAAINRSGTNRDRVAELQARELEKGAHLRTTHVEPGELAFRGDRNRLEKITRDDGRQYYRVPDHEDPLERGGSEGVALSHADLLPIQQLARMDEELLRSTTNTLPARLAAQLWKARIDSSVGDNPWRTGGKEVREYVTASDLKHWIRRREPGTSEAYAKKLVSRTIDAFLELSKHRVGVRKRTQRKNGLRYKERRIVLPTDAAIPGEGRRSESRTETGGTESDERSDDTETSNGGENATNSEDGLDTPVTADVHG